MQQSVTYSLPALVGSGTAATSIGTSTEVTLLTVTDPEVLRKSQLSIYMSVAPGSSTGVKFRYYFSPDGVTYYPLPTRAAATGILTDIPSELTSASYVDGSSNWVGMDAVPMPACRAFKVTAISATAAATLNSLVVTARDN